MLSSVRSSMSACLNIPNAAKHFQICGIKKTSYLKWVKCRWSRGVVGHLVPIRLTLAKPPARPRITLAESPLTVRVHGAAKHALVLLVVVVVVVLVPTAADLVHRVH